MTILLVDDVCWRDLLLTLDTGHDVLKGESFPSTNVFRLSLSHELLDSKILAYISTRVGVAWRNWRALHLDKIWSSEASATIESCCWVVLRKQRRDLLH